MIAFHIVAGLKAKIRSQYVFKHYIKYVLKCIRSKNEYLGNANGTEMHHIIPRIEWLIATPSLIDVNMIRTLVERIDHDVDYYTFESHEDHVLFWDAVIDWIFDLIEQQHPYVDWTELYQQTKNTIRY